jgi:beta-1,4-mannosyltransferase
MTYAPEHPAARNQGHTQHAGINVLRDIASRQEPAERRRYVVPETGDVLDSRGLAELQRAGQEYARRRISPRARSWAVEFSSRTPLADVRVTAPLSILPPSLAMSSAGGRSHHAPSPWPDIKHRAFVVTAMAVTVALIYVVQRLAWPSNAANAGGASDAWSWASLVWLAPLLPAVCELVGLLMYQHPRWLRRDQRIPQLVVWRIVSRGVNKEALTATILRCRKESRKLPLFRYMIEVIIDTSGDGLPREAPDLHYFLVPKSYQTSNATKAKARALNFALYASPLAEDGWIVHLDEETHPTPSGIRGIAQAISEEEASGQLRIGQGMITYHRDWKHHPLFTLSDCIRTGSDVGRTFLSMRIGAPLFGMHGSFIVVRNDVEKRVGFDLGQKGSVTEDAWWGYLQMDAGSRCRWVDGVLEEQCTQSVKDFLKQRRRWFSGLVSTALHSPARLQWRLMLGINMLAWALAPFAWGYTIAHFVTGGYVDPVVRALANGSFAVYVVTTLVGLRVNMTEHGIRNPLHRIGWCLTWLACMPVFSLLESVSVAYAIASPARGFHVVKK